MTADAKMEKVATGVRGRGVWEHFTVLDGLPDMKVECLAEDRDGMIWVGTHDGGAARYDGEHFECFSTDDGLSCDSVYSITEGLDGTIWFGTSRGLTRYDGKTFEVIDGSQEYSFLWGACVDDDGVMWFGLDRRPGKPAGVIRCDGRTAELIEAGTSGFARGNSVKSIATSGRDVYLCADDLHLLNDGVIAELPWPLQRSEMHSFNKLTADQSGELLVLASDGAFRYSGGDARSISSCDSPGYSASAQCRGEDYLSSYSGSLLRLRKDGSESVELQTGRSVQALLSDSSGALWVGTYGAGIVKTEPGRWRLFDSPSLSVSPTCVAAGGARDRMWVGSTLGLGSASVDRWVPVNTAPKYPVTAVLSDEEGGVWVGLRNGTVSYLSADGERQRRYASREVEGFSVVAIERGETPTEVWYACSMGLGLRKISNGQVVNAAEFIDDAPAWIGALCNCEDRGLLIGTNTGKGTDRLLVVQDSRIAVLDEFAHPVTAIESADECLYVGTTRGLRASGLSGHRFENHELECHSITCLCRDAFGRIWVGTEGAGLFLCRGSESTSVPLGQGPSWQVVNSIGIGRDGHVWIATPAGIAVYEEGTDVPPCAPGLAEGTLLDGALSMEAESRKDLSFRSHGATWKSSGTVIRWRIPEKNREWNLSPSRRFALPKLAEGDYTVEAHARDIRLRRSRTFRCEVQVRARRVDLMVEEALKAQGGIQFVGGSETVKSLTQLISQAAPSDLPILIQGETGTGKSLAGRLLHELSRRASGPFVSINCAAIADTLAESELFGHVKGAFTGAIRDRVGKFELANGGTLLLDEIGDLNPRIQAKLLHVIQDGTVEPVGGGKALNVDVRVLGATNRDIKSAIAEGSFREDLYFRLNAFELQVLPLRSRRGDIRILAETFLSEASARLSLPVASFTEEAICALLEYGWPGNVRELRHVVERAVLLSGGGTVDTRDLTLTAVSSFAESPTDGSGHQQGAVWPLMTWDQHEREYLESVLRETGGVIAGEKGAAVLLGLKSSTLRSRLKRLGLI
jgi:DNA-binding NtrC family response regulator/ligand-binding sensor domain-containing protein